MSASGRLLRVECAVTRCTAANAKRRCSRVRPHALLLLPSGRGDYEVDFYLKLLEYQQDAGKQGALAKNRRLAAMHRCAAGGWGCGRAGALQGCKKQSVRGPQHRAAGSLLTRTIPTPAPGWTRRGTLAKKRCGTASRGSTISTLGSTARPRRPRVRPFCVPTVRPAAGACRVDGAHRPPLLHACRPA